MLPNYIIYMDYYSFIVAKRAMARMPHKKAVKYLKIVRRENIYY